jgi:hypothetical protein
MRNTRAAANAFLLGERHDQRRRRQMPDPREITEGTWPDRPKPYPAVSKTDTVQAEPRSFDPAADAPTPQEPPRDACPASMTDGRMGPGGDPAEGKR